MQVYFYNDPDEDDEDEIEEDFIEIVPNGPTEE